MWGLDCDVMWLKRKAEKYNTWDSDVCESMRPYKCGWRRSMTLHSALSIELGPCRFSGEHKLYFNLEERWVTVSLPQEPNLLGSTQCFFL